MKTLLTTAFIALILSTTGPDAAAQGRPPGGPGNGNGAGPGNGPGAGPVGPGFNGRDPRFAPPPPPPPPPPRPRPPLVIGPDGRPMPPPPPPRGRFGGWQPGGVRFVLRW